MLSSFTKNEKKLMLSFAGLLLVGSVVTPWLRQGAKSDVFPAASTRLPEQSAPSTSAAPLLGGQPAVAADGRIDLNAADEKTLESIPGIGPAKAAAIIEYRTRTGGFRTVQELDAVRGIGPGILAKIAPHVTVSAPARPVAFVGGAGSKPAATGGTGFWRDGWGQSGTAACIAAGSDLLSLAFRPQQWFPQPPPPHPSPPCRPPWQPGLVNINTATYEQLQSLKYVGPAKARAIIEHRTRSGPFPTVESLDAVKGIGRQVLDANRGRIVVR